MASFDKFLVNVQNMLQQNAVVVSIYLFSSWANRHPNTCKLNPVGDLKTYQTLFLKGKIGKLFDTFDQSGKVSSFKTTKCQKYETNLGKHNPMWRLKVGLLILLRLQGITMGPKNLLSRFWISNNHTIWLDIFLFFEDAIQKMHIIN